MSLKKPIVGGFSQFWFGENNTGVYKVFGLTHEKHQKSLLPKDLVAELNAYTILSSVNAPVMSFRVVPFFDKFDIVCPALLFPVLDYTLDTYIRDMMSDSIDIRFDTAMDVFTDICIMLKYLKYTGLVHRDINQRNIMYDSSEGIFRLIDFGLAMYDSRYLGIKTYLHKTYRDYATTRGEQYDDIVMSYKAAPNIMTFCGNDVPLRPGDDRLFDNSDDLYMLAVVCLQVLWKGRLKVKNTSIVKALYSKKGLYDKSQNVFINILVDILKPHNSRITVESCLRRMRYFSKYDKKISEVDHIELPTVRVSLKVDAPQYIKDTDLYKMSFEEAPKLMSLVYPLADTIDHLTKKKFDTKLVLIAAMTFIHNIFYNAPATIWERYIDNDKWDVKEISFIRMISFANGLHRII